MANDFLKQKVEYDKPLARIITLCTRRATMQVASPTNAEDMRFNKQYDNDSDFWI